MIDFAFAILMIIACVKGFQKGLIVALFSIIAFIIGLAAALKLSSVVAVWLSGSLNVGAKWMPFLSFALVFLVVVWLVRLGGRLIEKTFKMALLGWVNRLGGILFYAMLYIIIFSIFLFYSQKINLLEPSAIESSKTFNFVQPWGPLVIDNFAKIIPGFKNTFSDLEHFFGNVGNKIPH